MKAAEQFFSYLVLLIIQHNYKVLSSNFHIRGEIMNNVDSKYPWK